MAKFDRKSKGIDRKFLLRALKLERSVQVLLDTLEKDLLDALRVYSRGDTFENQAEFDRYLVSAVDEFMARYIAEIGSANRDIAVQRLNQLLTEVSPKLIKAGLESQATLLTNQARTYTETITQRLMYSRWTRDGQTLQARIKTIRDGTIRTVRNIIAVDMENGRGARDIARHISIYINPAGGERIKPFDLHRMRFGRSRNYVPRGIPSGSVQYNAMRIARTETAHNYRQSVLDFYNNKEWVKGFKWVMSASHPDTDICDEYAKETYKTPDDVPQGHPNCLCRVEPILMTQDELEKLKAQE